MNKIKLYLLIIEEFDNDIKIENLSIIKETDKSYRINKNLSSRHIINKNEINKMNDKFIPYIITDDISTGASILRNFYQNKMNYYENYINILKEIINKMDSLIKSRKDKINE